MDDLSNLSDEEFQSLFNGKYYIGGEKKLAKTCEKFVFDHPAPKRVLQTCMVFYSKPKMLLATGLTKKGKGDGRSVQEALLKFLPKLTEEQIATTELSAQFRNTFLKHVNFSMVKFIALHSFETLSTEKEPLVKQYNDLLTKPTNDETEEIRTSDVEFYHYHVENVDLRNYSEIYV